MSQRGRPFQAIITAMVASTVGGVISALVLLVAAPFVSVVTIKFAPPELFAVSVFGLSVIAAISGKSFWKGLLSGSVGILVSQLQFDGRVEPGVGADGYVRRLCHSGKGGGNPPKQ